MGQTVGWALNVTEFVFPPVRCSYDKDHDNLVFFPAGADADIPAMLVPPSLSLDAKRKDLLGEKTSFCVIYFHPNAVDIGDCVHDLFNIRDGVFKGDAVVLAPEYCGYGLLSEYRPSVESIDLVSAAAWRFCRKALGFRGDQIVLWGRSIGTGPACSMAAWRAKRSLEKEDKKDFIEANSQRSLGAVVLVAPFTSVTEVALWHTNKLVASLVSPMWEVLELVKDEGLEDIPFCVVHPREDEVIPFSHGEAIFESCASKLKFCLWVDDATHNFPMEDEHLKTLRSFLAAHLITRQKRRATCPSEVSSFPVYRSREDAPAASSKSRSRKRNPAPLGTEMETSTITLDADMIPLDFYGSETCDDTALPSADGSRIFQSRDKDSNPCPSGTPSSEQGDEDDNASPSNSGPSGNTSPLPQMERGRPLLPNPKVRSRGQAQGSTARGSSATRVAGNAEKTATGSDDVEEQAGQPLRILELCSDTQKAIDALEESPKGRPHAVGKTSSEPLPTVAPMPALEADGASCEFSR